MVLTPIDVQQKTFATAMRGYDLDEVDDFLDKVVISLKDYEQRLRDAQERNATLESELSQRSDQESAISRALVAAQRSADALLDEAREEARGILADAESHASELEGRRDEERRALTDEIESIRAQLGQLRSGVATMLASVASGLDDVETFVDGETEESGGPAKAATFDAAEPMDVEDSMDDDEAADEPLSEKIVIDGSADHATADHANDDSWDLDEEGSFDGDESNASASIDAITDRIDEVFGDLDDEEDDDKKKRAISPRTASSHPTTTTTTPIRTPGRPRPTTTAATTLDDDDMPIRPWEA